MHESFFRFAGVDASFARITSYIGEAYGFSELPNTYNSFTQPDAQVFRTKVSSGPTMFLDMLTDGSETADGVEVYVNLLLEGMLINIVWF